MGQPEPPLKPTICSSVSENGTNEGPPLKLTICSRARVGKAKKDLLITAPWRREEDDESHKLQVTSEAGSTSTMC
ncbi:hypothetical protein QYF36_005346 [Acer negundo]|nr:hypothetical protein QYF36_005346 [Acer negundo]